MKESQIRGATLLFFGLIQLSVLAASGSREAFYYEYGAIHTVVIDDAGFYRVDIRNTSAGKDLAKADALRLNTRFPRHSPVRPRHDVRNGILRIWVERSGFDIFQLASGHYIGLMVPDGIKLVVKGTSGSIRVQGVSGTLKINTRQGSVSLHEIKGQLQVETRTGTITAKNVYPDFGSSCFSRTGRILLDISPNFPEAGLRAVTRRGRLRVNGQDHRGRNYSQNNSRILLDVETVNGSIDIFHDSVNG